MAAKKNDKELSAKLERVVTIKAPNIAVAEFEVSNDGEGPLVQNRFANKAKMMDTQRAGSQANSKKVRSPKDFEAQYLNAQHFLSDGARGIPAAAFRNAMISACRLVNYKMTLAKISIFIVADGYDKEGYPMVRFKGEPEMHTAAVRNANGSVDIHARPMFKKWSCTLRVRFDNDQFSHTDVANLLMRAGLQVGIQEGRNDSKNSAGMGWGGFTIEEKGVLPAAETKKKAARSSRAK